MRVARVSGGLARDNFIAFVSSARLQNAEELPRATLCDHCGIIVRGEGDGSLLPSSLFLSRHAIQSVSQERGHDIFMKIYLHRVKCYVEIGIRYETLIIGILTFLPRENFPFPAPNAVGVTGSI